jgi:hypothetical protein
MAAGKTASWRQRERTKADGNGKEMADDNSKQQHERM